MPGETGYARTADIEALREAIESTKHEKTWNALRPHRYLGGKHDAPLRQDEIDECFARFDATMSQLCANDPLLCEAYLGAAKMKSKLRLVYSAND